MALAPVHPRLSLIALAALPLAIACKRNDKDAPPAEPAAPPTAAAASGAAAKPTGGGDPCSLLSPTEIAAVIGNPVKAGVVEAGRSCDYDNDDPALNSVLIRWIHDDPQRTCAALLPTAPTAVAVAGLGDQAAWEWEPIGGEAGSVTACKGKDVVMVQIVGGMSGKKGEAYYRPMAESLVKVALGKI